MNWADYMIPVSHYVGKHGYFSDTTLVYNGEPDFQIPSSTKVAIIGVPEDRFSEGAGEIKSPGVIRKYLYALSSGSQGTVVDLGNLRTGKTLADTYFGLMDVLSVLYQQNIVTLLIGGTLDIFYGNYMALAEQDITLSTITPQLRLPMQGSENHPLNTLMFDHKEPQTLNLKLQTSTAQPSTKLNFKPVHICNIGYQSYYVPQQDLDDFNDSYFEAYRLGEVREGNMRGIEPVIRDSDLLAISMNAVKYSDAPAASNTSPNGFAGEEICQLALFAGLSHRCQSTGIFDMIPHNDLQGITAKLAAQMAWYFIEGVKRRNPDNPKDDVQNFKKYLIYFDQLHHNLCFYKNNRTERWWIEVPSISNDNESLMISCTPEDYTKASEQEIPDRWWKTYQRIN